MLSPAFPGHAGRLWPLLRWRSVARTSWRLLGFRFFGVAFGFAGHGLDVDDAGPWLHHAGQEREVLAEGVPLEPGRQVDVPHVGVAGEADAVHLVDLAL